MNLNQQEYYIEQMIVSLRTRLLVMGASVEIAVDNMHKAVKELNVGTAQAVIERPFLQNPSLWPRICALSSAACAW